LDPIAPQTRRGPDERELSRRVDDQLCFAIYAASRAVTALYRPMLERLGLTYPQYLVMLALWERDGILVGELAEALSLDYGTLSPLLKRMELAGLIRRERRVEDERSVCITLTERGRELDACAAEIPPAIAEGMGLDPAGLTGLRDALRQLTESVERAAQP
jgi:MarR family transcriptional regulator, organic hydroperoxide resistance regulator